MSHGWRRISGSVSQYRFEIRTVRAERLCEKVSCVEVSTEGTELSVAISIGIASRQPDMSAPASWSMRPTRRSMLRRRGRNRTCVFSMDPPARERRHDIATLQQIVAAVLI
jgi:hypothetical protein